MAVLSSGELAKLSTAIQQEYSRDNKEIPVNKDVLLALITDMDKQIDLAETDIVNNVKDANARTWVNDDKDVRRTLMERIDKARKDGKV